MTPLDTMTVFWRSKNISKFRTKCMVKPYLIFEMGIHHVSKPIWANLEVLMVDASVAYVHHYRACMQGIDVSCGEQTRDDVMLRYKARVIDALLVTKNTKVL